jgi:metal-sulfur cluster biosynthetic enzyme
MATALEVSVREAIAKVDDPCSVRANAPLNVFELGLVRSWSVGPDDDVHVMLSPTAPSCVLIGSIMEGIRERVGEVPGVASVDVQLDSETFWTPDLMSDEGRRKLHARRTGSMQRVPLRPRQWREHPRGFELPVVTTIEQSSGPDVAPDVTRG